MKSIRAILLLTSILALSVEALSDEGYNKKPAFNSMGAKEFRQKHCDRACISVILGTYYALHDMSCKVDKEDYEKNPSKYQWLNTYGEWTYSRFKFAGRTSPFINWQTSKVIVAIAKMPNDWDKLDLVVRDVIDESILDVVKHCAAVNGALKRW
jgi:hypothetical protein